MSGRRLPGEWEPQDGVLVAWPHSGTDWAPYLDAVEPVYGRLGTEISRRERLLVLCPDLPRQRRAEAALRAAGADPEAVRLLTVPYDDTWTRDYGPLTVVTGDGPVLLDFRFDGWGGKFPAARDDAATRALAAGGVFGPSPVESVPRVLEGGAVDSDGRGTLLTTRECLSHRPWPDPDPDAIAAELLSVLGGDRVLWLEHGRIEGDDTDGHVDTLARFCGPETLAYVACDEPDYPHFRDLGAMAEELQGFRQADGRPYRLVPLPWPPPKLGPDGTRLPATYANFLVINGAVLVPGYDDPADGAALERLQEAFPGREVVLVPALPLTWQHGSIHCVTMQLPRGSLAS